VLGGGHYTALARNPRDGQWYRFDDPHVHVVAGAAELVVQSAYVLFYRRRQSEEAGGGDVAVAAAAPTHP
jgi:ubiquitin carboxyl-terminal hydrolase 4/11/15